MGDAFAVPDEMRCVICTGIMKDDPVICGDGYTYDRRCIERWFKEKRTSPKTNLELTSLALIPNHDMRNLIQAMLPRMPEGQVEELCKPCAPVEPQGQAGERRQHGTPTDVVEPGVWDTQTYSFRVVSSPGDSQNGTYELREVDADVTAGVVAELIAEHLGVHVSRIRLKIDGVGVDVLTKIPNIRQIEVDILGYDWADIVEGCPTELKDEFMKMAEESHPLYPKLQWKDTAEFIELVRLKTTLFSGTPTRGPAQTTDMKWESQEFLEVLQEARSKKGATPATVLRDLREEFD